MPTRLSAALNVQQSVLQLKGVYDGLLDFDSRLHIDPALIESSGIKELAKAKQKTITYFSDILRLIKQSQNTSDIFWNAAVPKLATGEGLNTALGYSADGTKGSGIGRELAIRILLTIKTIQKAGLEDPFIFELVGIFESNIGADRISDLISTILHEELCAYTYRVCNELKIPTKKFKVSGNIFELPENPLNNEYIVFIPEKILNNLPISEEWDDVDFSAKYNAEVRKKLNSLIGDSWREASKAKKETLKEIFIENPDILSELLELYKKRPKRSYDFNIDHIGELLWDAIGYNIAEKIKLDLGIYQNLKVSQVFEVAIKICEQFQLLVETNGLVEHLWDKNGKKRPERFPQLLLFAVADSYCNANNIDLNREPNAGSGALDFKFSNGLAKVTCEVKYSSNNNLLEGFEKQLTAYNQAERVATENSIYLIIKVNENSNDKIQKIIDVTAERNAKGIPTSKVIVINGVKQPSASKRKI
jgi:hypothetical protein